MSTVTVPAAQARLQAFFDQKGWKPFAYQRKVWDAYLKGRSGLIHAPTGTGKTYAALMGPVKEFLAEGSEETPTLAVLWLTPLRALAADTEASITEVVEAFDLPWSVQRRTGDTSASIKAGQRERLPSVLITTPESLTILLSYSNARTLFKSMGAIVVDEWHELMGSKRGVQTELALARLRRWHPDVRTWGLSATLGNLEEAANVLMGNRPGASESLVISSQQRKEITIDTLWPEDIERFPWSGHLGLKMLQEVVEELEQVGSALIFTNTRSQTEEWFRALLEARPDWAGEIALHHGSLDRKQRTWVERALADGRLRCVVCTSSLDLGVDFTPVERVFQVGSPKGVGRLLQRAGRSGHQPGAVSRATGIPAHSFELLEFAAARRAAKAGQIESRQPPKMPVDLLVQHVVTIAAGGGFEKYELLDEVRSTHTFAELDEPTWEWVIDFAETGGGLLSAYDQYKRIGLHKGRYIGTTVENVRRHRMSIGTIVSDPMVTVKFGNGRKLGTIEESFLARMQPDDSFHFAGRQLSLVRLRGLEAVVRIAKNTRGPIPRWAGGRFSLSTQLADSMRDLIDDVSRGPVDEPEVDHVMPLLNLQREWSEIPRRGELLIERAETRDGYHIFMFPFAGRAVHEGLTQVLAWRLAQLKPTSFATSCNDYGFELLSRDPPPLVEALKTDLFSTETLARDIRESLNESELARRQFRNIARIAGLVFTGFPGQGKSLKQIQSTTGLVYDVFERYDRDNPLMEQARREVLELQLQEHRLRAALERMETSDIHIVDTPALTPFAFPIAVDRLRETVVSTEKLADRVRRLQRQLEKRART